MQQKINSTRPLFHGDWQAVRLKITQIVTFPMACISLFACVPIAGLKGSSSQPEITPTNGKFIHSIEPPRAYVLSGMTVCRQYEAQASGSPGTGENNVKNLAEQDL